MVGNRQSEHTIFAIVAAFDGDTRVPAGTAKSWVVSVTEPVRLRNTMFCV